MAQKRLSWTKSTSGKDAGTPEYTQEIRSAIRKAKQGELVAFHNHPANMPPSDGDLNAAMQNGYGVGYVLCHDGKIYKYTAPKREINRAFYDLRVADYKRIPYNYSEEQAQRKALTEMQEEFDFLFQEVK